MKYEVVIGLEVHVELATESKIFCSCGAHGKPEGPNDCVCPACCGMPGMLPVTNKRVVELAVMAGTLLNCHINQYTTFDKKSYYYPDLPCAYQITQWFNPVCVNGLVELETENGIRKIGIKQIHMEEDAGKLVHDEWSDTSLVDFNRTSVPLIEIVSRPDFRSASDVIAYLEKLKSMFRFAGISECEEGAMRCDVNLSIRPEGSDELGVRTEMKNMSSLTAITRAIEFETARHIDALERGTEKLVQETRRWDDVKGRSFSMRNKETAADYRYFPDPNLMPIIIDDEWLAEIRASMTGSPEEKRASYIEMGISEKDAVSLTSERVLSVTFDKTNAICNAPKEVAAWLLTECGAILRRKGQVMGDLRIEPEKLAKIITMVSDGSITRGAGKKVLSAVIDDGSIDPEQYCKDNAMDVQGDEGFIASVVQKVVDANPKSVADYKSGKTKAIQALFGGVMRELKGNGDPAVINKLLTDILNK